MQSLVISDLKFVCRVATLDAIENWLVEPGPLKTDKFKAELGVSFHQVPVKDAAARLLQVLSQASPSLEEDEALPVIVKRSHFMASSDMWSCIMRESA